MQNSHIFYTNLTQKGKPMRPAYRKQTSKAMIEARAAGYLSIHTTVDGMDKSYRQEINKYKQQWAAAAKLMPENAFADDVADDDVGHYYPSMTVVEGGLHYE